MTVSGGEVFEAPLTLNELQLKAGAALGTDIRVARETPAPARERLWLLRNPSIGWEQVTD